MQTPRFRLRDCWLDRAAVTSICTFVVFFCLYGLTVTCDIQPRHSIIGIYVYVIFYSSLLASFWSNNKWEVTYLQFVVCFFLDVPMYYLVGGLLAKFIHLPDYLTLWNAVFLALTLNVAEKLRSVLYAESQYV